MSSVSALDAAVQDIKTVILNEGRISAAGISNIIDRSNAVVAFIHKYFPNAAGSSVITDKVQATLDELNIGEDNLLYAQSVCPDEINHHREGCITTDFINTFGRGKCFHLGGLGGIPFTGKTGWGAFTHHIPDGGNALVLQAPHIGMSNSLKLGQFTRDGQSHDGSACGAAVGALNHCCSGQPVPDLTECPDDYQMCFIMQEVQKCLQIIEDSYINSSEFSSEDGFSMDENARQATLAKQMHRIGKNMLDSIVKDWQFGDDNSCLFVLTGIQINMPFEFEDWFMPISFEMHHKDGTVVDLFDRTFGRGITKMRSDSFATPSSPVRRKRTSSHHVAGAVSPRSPSLPSIKSQLELQEAAMAAPILAMPSLNLNSPDQKERAKKSVKSMAAIVGL